MLPLCGNKLLGLDEAEEKLGGRKIKLVREQEL
jgi:hypothetical protein